MSAKEQKFFESQWDEEWPRSCYVDTRWEDEQATVMVGEHAVRVGYCKSALCFYGGKNKGDPQMIAESIVRASPNVGISAKWTGNVKTAIKLSCLAE